ncbi:MAG: catalase family peroxidase [Acetobacteraceae bacterium]
MTSPKLSATAAVLFAGLAAGGAWAQSASTAVQTVDAMNALWGRHSHTRANHAKGVVVEGRFTPEPAAAALSTASIFAGPPVPVTVRFSDSTGIPTLPDGSPPANPHGMSIKFHTADGNAVDMVINSLPFFPVATGEEFLALLQALAVSGPDAPKPTKAETFMAAHPSVAKAFGAIATPSSFARERYNGVNAFIFVNKDGARQPFRLRVVPVDGVEHLTPADAARMPPDFLVDELPQRLAKGPVVFRMMAQLANPGDQTKDPTQPWPEDRRVIDLGTITLSTAVADSDAAQRQLYYLPNRLQPGIEVSDDPLIDARVRAYVISFGRRAQ